MGGLTLVILTMQIQKTCFRIVFWSSKDPINVYTFYLSVNYDFGRHTSASLNNDLNNKHNS